MYFSVPPANLLIAMSYLPLICEHISERAVELGLMPMADCYWSKLEQLENNNGFQFYFHDHFILFNDYDFKLDRFFKEP
jgi:hypothetical protein